MNSGIQEHFTPVHRLRLIASFALLGAVIAGSARLIPALAAVSIDWHAAGAVLGAAAGALAQILRH